MNSGKPDKEKELEQQNEVLRKQILASMPPIPVSAEEREAQRAAKAAAAATEYERDREMLVIVAVSSVLAWLTMLAFNLF